MDEIHAKKPGKHAYRRPRLTVYGDLRTVTLSNVSNNMNDKGNGSQAMT